jgi:uncharacterized membrane protein
VTERRLGWLFAGAGSLGLLASSVLTYERFRFAQDPSYHPACSINPVISCGSVMKSAAANLFFGVPNSAFGLIAFAALVAFGLVLITGRRPGRRVWLAAQTLAAGGLLFVAFLIFQSLAVIGALCPWCVLVWCVTIPVFLYVTLFNLREGHLPTPEPASAAVAIAGRWHRSILVGFYALLGLVIVLRFWYYWKTLL